MSYPKLKLVLQAVIFTLLSLISLLLSWLLIQVLTDIEVNEAMAALLGTLTGAFATALGLAAKDFFNPNDNGGGG